MTKLSHKSLIVIPLKNRTSSPIQCLIIYIIIILIYKVHSFLDLVFSGTDSTLNLCFICWEILLLASAWTSDAFFIHCSHASLLYVVVSQAISVHKMTIKMVHIYLPTKLPTSLTIYLPTYVPISMYTTYTNTIIKLKYLPWFFLVCTLLFYSYIRTEWLCNYIILFRITFCHF